MSEINMLSDGPSSILIPRSSATVAVTFLSLNVDTSLNIITVLYVLMLETMTDSKAYFNKTM